MMNFKSSQELCSLNIKSEILQSGSDCHTIKKLKIKVFFSNPEVQSVNIHITQDNDSQFLYISRITAEDYPLLKQNQGLLVNFNAFPGKLVELLQVCAQEQGKSNPKYSLCLHGRTGSDTLLLEVIESNPFKRLCHLSISVSPATGEDKLLYLSETLQRLKDAGSRRERELEDKYLSLEHQLKSCSHQLSESQQALKESQRHHRGNVEAMQKEHDSKVNEYRQKILRIQSDNDRRVERLATEADGKLTARTNVSQQRIDSLAAEVRTAVEAKAALENTNRDLKSQLSSSEKACSNLRQELSHLSSNHSRLKESFTTTARREESVKASMKSLSEENEKLHKALEQAMRQLSEHKHRLSDVEQRNELVTAKCAKREQSAKNLFIELHNSLEKIKQLQGENAALSHDKKALAEDVKEMRQIKELQCEQLTKVKEQVDTLESEIGVKKQREKELSEEVDALNEKLKVENNKILTKDNMIEWLNRRLSDSEKSAAIVQASPLTGAYLPPKGAAKEQRYVLAETVPCTQKEQRYVLAETVPCTQKEQRYVLAESAPCKEQRFALSHSSEVSPNLQTSTPVNRLDASKPDTMRRVAFANSLSAVRTPTTATGKENSQPSQNLQLSPELLEPSAAMRRKEQINSLPDRILQVVRSDADSVEIIDTRKGGLLRETAIKSQPKWKV